MVKCSKKPLTNYVPGNSGCRGHFVGTGPTVYPIGTFEAQYGCKAEVTISNNEEMIAMLIASRGAGFELYENEQAYKEMLGKVSAKLIKNKPLVAEYWASSADLLASMRSGSVVIAKGWNLSN